MAKKISEKQRRALARGRKKRLANLKVTSSKKRKSRVSMVRKRKSRKKTHTIHGMTTAGAFISGYDYLIGGGAGANALKSGNLPEYSRNVRATITDSSIGQHVVNNLPLIVGLAGSSILGRKNPGIRLGKLSFKLF